jgi:hypothetical protein
MTAPAIDHIGIIVEDLGASVALMSKMLPGAPTRRRSMPEVGLEVVEFLAANVIIELLQYTSAQPSMGRESMGDAAGINHLSIKVSNLDGSLSSLAGEGIAPMSGFPRTGAHGRIAFLKMDERLPFRVELCQPDEVSHD